MTQQTNKPIESPLFPQLVLTLDIRRNTPHSFLRPILQTKSFACVILYDSEKQKDNGSFLQQQAQIYAEDIQNNDAALLITDDSRIAGRIKADGLHIEDDLNALESFKNQQKEQKILGFGNLRNRHSAMLAAETGVDYLLFGKLGADKKPHAHPRNLQLAAWWAEIMETPAIIQAGSDFATFDEALKTGCEFVAVEEVILGNDNPLILLKTMQEKCENTPL
ncbi:thiamine phosphate synthase [Bartonella tribocorum]|uniref:Thiamine-phosphate pyrophosphorylase n=1 Tax=Bartonella tribocorum (strain DSM 28219 / CCUG 45778 / CIP 105476 / IBS 506) TaxID=382640 RepID=A9IYL5_BART1|nr:thiamine phosphate synthase [Bartonella tribocorum]CAK02385.1 thiamine-phosphate pyrophosphorylase [Bartonella tribocorum CIP 105476]CDO49725.1 thiamine-phosphate pyrophosphorylase [Bartonella tribocorum]